MFNDHNHGHIILRKYYVQIARSQQVERSMIISNKYGICELPHELPTDFRARILRN